MTQSETQQEAFQHTRGSYSAPKKHIEISQKGCE